MKRQGDILIVKHSEIPSTAKKEKKCVLALGEVTGHKHQIKEDAFLWLDTDGTKYIEVYSERAVVVHEEHGPIELDGPAIYKVIIQREYYPEQIRNVLD